MNEQITLSPELEARVHQAVENFMQGHKWQSFFVKKAKTANIED